MILTTCKYFDLVGNRCSRVTDGKCNNLQDCEFKYIAELKAENNRLKERVKEIGEKMSFLNADRCSEIMRYKQTLQEIDEIISRTDSQHPPSVANMVSIIRHKLYELTKAEEE